MIMMNLLIPKWKIILLNLVKKKNEYIKNLNNMLLEKNQYKYANLTIMNPHKFQIIHKKKNNLKII